MTKTYTVAWPLCGVLLVLMTACNGGGTNTPVATPEPVIQASEATMALYNRSCISCHASGSAGAPRTGDATAWAARIDQGREMLLKRTKSGWIGMPPMGTCTDCTDEQFIDLIEYMAQSKITKP